MRAASPRRQRPSPRLADTRGAARLTGPTAPEDGARAARRASARPRPWRWRAGASSASSSAARCRRRWPPTGWPAPGTRTRALHSHVTGDGALEEVALRWLLELLGLPPDCGGAFVTGATMANFTRAGRRAPCASWRGRAGTSRRDGLFGAPPITVVVGAEAHPSLLQGAGPARARPQPGRRACRSTGRGGCGPTRCPRSSGPTIVCLQAGNVNTGAFDPLGEICARARVRRRLGARRRRVRPLGGGRARARPPRGAASPTPTRGPPTRTSGSTCPTTAASRSCATPRRCGRRWRSPRTICRARAPCRNPVGLYAGAVAPRARRRGLGGAALARPQRRGRADRAHLPPRPALRRGPAAAGYEVLNEVVLNQVLVSFGDAETTAQRHRGDPGRRHLLVRRHGLAGAERPCASASPRGRRPTTMSSAAWRPCCELRRRTRRKHRTKKSKKAA